MSRAMESTMSAALQERVVRPVLIGRLDIATDPVVAWTGPGNYGPSGTDDDALNGQTFAPLAPFIAVTDIEEDLGIGGPVTLTLSGHDLDSEALRQIVRDKREWRGRSAWLWVGLLDENEFSVIADPVRIKTGVMTSMKTKRDGKNAMVEVTIDEDLGNAKSAPFRWVDHARLFSSDTFSTYVTKLFNRPKGLQDTGIHGRGSAFVRIRNVFFD